MFSWCEWGIRLGTVVTNVQLFVTVAELLKNSIASAFCVQQFIFVFSKNLFVFNNSYLYSVKSIRIQ